MSRYVILIILNLPLVIAAMLNAIVNYKLRRISARRLVFRLLLWSVLLAGLLLAEPVYNLLFSKNLTQTEPLSLFDVIQITGIITALFVATQAYTKIEQLEKRVRDLHTELSISLSGRSGTQKVSAPSAAKRRPRGSRR